MQHLLFLHGAIGAADQLQPIADQLKIKFHTHLFNFSGHGGKPQTEPFSIPTFAAEVLNYLEEHKITKINIFGYSMGGYVALYLAKHHPEKINTIFTLATKFLWTPAIAQQEIKMLNAEQVDAIVYDRPQLMHYINTHKDDDLELATAEYYQQGYGFAFPKESNLVFQVNRTLLELSEDQQISEIIEEYLGKPK